MQTPGHILLPRPSLQEPARPPAWACMGHLLSQLPPEHAETCSSISSCLPPISTHPQATGGRCLWVRVTNSPSTCGVEEGVNSGYLCLGSFRVHKLRPTQIP